MKLPRKTRLLVTLVGAVLVVSAAGSLPWPKLAAPARTTTVHADGGCSIANLSGPYAVSRQGTLLTSVLGLPAPAPWGEVALADFDGAGAFSGKANVNIGGVAINASFTGTYTINSDCTGNITVHPNVPAPVTITESIVVIGGGRQYVGTDMDSFSVVETRAERIGD